jgi:hypothetical protein
MMFCGDSCKNRVRVNGDGKRCRGHVIKFTTAGEDLEPNCAEKTIRHVWRTTADSNVGFASSSGSP